MSDDNAALLLQVSADIRGLEKAFDRAAGVVKARGKQMEASGTSLEKFFGKPSLARALDKTFDATRFKVLDSGAARVGLFGSALEALGPIGLGAAAAIGGVAVALAQAKAAMDFADELGDTANKLHVTTDALQEYRYAIRLAGGEAKGADEALASFSVTLGKAQQGLAKSQRAFLALGFTKDQIKGFADVDTALKAVTDRIGGLKNFAQKDAIISQLGLTGLAPLILEGADAMTRLREEAHKAGVVMDAELIRRAGASKEEFETLSQVINMQMKQAFLDLAPTLIKVMGLLAQMATLIGNIADAFRGIDDKSARGLENRAQFLIGEIATKNEQLARARPGSPAAKDFDTVIQTLRAELNDVRFEQRLRSGNRAPAIPSGSALIDTTGGGGSRGPSAAELAAAERRLRIEHDLAVATAAGDKARVEALQYELNLAKQIDDLTKAGVADADEIAMLRMDEVAAAEGVARYAAEQAVAEQKTADAIKSRLQKEAEITAEKQRQIAEAKDQAAADQAAADAKLNDANKAQVELAQNAHDALYNSTYDAVRGAFDALAQGRVWEYFVNRLKAALLDNLAGSIAAALTGGGPSSGGGGLGGSLLSAGAAIFGGARAGGGPVSGGRAYLVGERGPELFVPNVSGAIRPNGAGGVVQHFTIDARGALGVDQLITFIEHRSQAAESRAVSRSLASVTRSNAMRLA
jgi:hypothetical protein